MIWEQFIYFAITAVLLWAVGAWAAWRNKTALTYISTVIGLAVFFSFILMMWISLEHPPLRTMGETRLWYSFFLPLAGIIVYSRWKYKWILSFSTVLALVFICVNIFKPEIHSKTLMPALQSPWFAPHVIVYMFAYAVLGASTVMALYLLFIKKNRVSDEEYEITDNLVYVGLAFMTIGMLFGALWAKEAWGHYWGWDPKETWALITMLVYAVQLHWPWIKNKSQITNVKSQIVYHVLSVINFLFVLFTYFGVKYLLGGLHSYAN